MHKEIGKIKETSLGFEDHGIFTVYLHMDYGGSGQGVGGHALDAPVRDENDKHIGRRCTGYAGDYIKAVIKACGVDSWEKVKGRTIFVLKEDDGWNAKVLGIENLPTEPGKRFLFEELRKQHFAD